MPILQALNRRESQVHDVSNGRLEAVLVPADRSEAPRVFALHGKLQGRFQSLEWNRTTYECDE